MNIKHVPVAVLTAFVALAVVASGVVSAAEKHPGEKAFAAQVASEHGVPEARILKLLDQAERKQSIIDAMRRPAESLPWTDYRAIFMTPLRVRAGIAFYKTNRALLQRVADEYGVDPQYIVAILGVESNYGTITGSYRVLDALVTLAFHYPPRADFFRGELEKLLTMPDTQLPGPLLDIKGSYAGAMGWGQFMPTSVAAYARDEDSDGHINLLESLPDILASVANYLARHGWERGAPVAIDASRDADAAKVKTRHSRTIHTVAELQAHGYQPRAEVPGNTPATLLTLEGADGPLRWLTFNNFHVITRYNHSPLYAMVVTQLAAAIADGIEPAASAAQGLPAAAGGTRGAAVAGRAQQGSGHTP